MKVFTGVGKIRAVVVAIERKMPMGGVRWILV
jgi:hypothetical protein